jgi:hypothetical protein
MTSNGLRQSQTARSSSSTIAVNVIRCLLGASQPANSANSACPKLRLAQASLLIRGD